MKILNFRPRLSYFSLN